MEFLGYQLSEEEEIILKGYLEQSFKGVTELKEGEFTQLLMTRMMHKSLGGGNQAEAQNSMAKFNH